MGDVEERPPGPLVAGPAGEEAALSAAASRLPPLPHGRGQPQAARQPAAVSSSIKQSVYSSINSFTHLIRLSFQPSINPFTHLIDVIN